MFGFTFGQLGLKALPYVLAIAALFGAVKYLEHVGAKRAEQQHKLEQLEADKRMLIEVQAIGAAIGHGVALADQKNAERLASIETTNRTIIQPTLTKEIASDPRLSNPDLGITDGLRSAIDAARDLSCRPGAAGSVVCPLPAPQPAGGQ
jgi:hypothetical protein